MRTSLVAPLVAVISLASVEALAVENGASGQTNTRPESKFTAGVGLEVAFVGLSVGLRPELLYRLGSPATVSHLRTSIGLLFGPEFTMIPVSIGYRAIWRQDKTVQPLFGAGFGSNFFLVNGERIFSQLGVVYFEGGSGFAITDRISTGGVATLEWSFLNERGPGISARAFGTLKF